VNKVTWAAWFQLEMHRFKEKCVNCITLWKQQAAKEMSTKTGTIDIHILADHVNKHKK